MDKLYGVEKAISPKQEAVSLTPDSHPDKPGWLSNLGTSVQSRFERLGDVKDLESAISFQQAAIHLTPDGHPDRPGRLNRLGRSVLSRFEHLRDFEDLEKAISFYQTAVDLTPDGHSDKPGQLDDLGRAFWCRFRSKQTPSDLQSAIILLSASATSPTGPSSTRFRSAATWAQLLHTHGKNPLSAFGCAIDLLHQIAWPGMSLVNQHSQPAEAGNLVRYAVAVAIERQEYETAVQWSEYGRSIVWRNLLGLRNLDDLHKAHPELAMRLKYILQRLEGSLSNHNLPEQEELVSLQDAAQKLATERDRILERVRRIPGFEYFLKAKTFDKLAPAAYGGPVAILNVHELRSDALILIPHSSQDKTTSIVHIPLKSFSHDMSENLLRTLSQILSSIGARAPDEQGHESHIHDGKNSFKSILYSLWVHVVKPILDGLAYQPGNNSRIWWCASGSLAFLPIHAAGDYDSNGVGENILDYVVSSYTPTLTALLDQSQPDMTEDFQILTVAQPSTPHTLPLPGTEREVRLIKEIANNTRVKSLISDEATATRVLQAIRESNWIHLACHGMQNMSDPLKSGFLFHDRTLELSELIKEPLPKADFAFLSACQTAMGDENIAEESVHLAAGMLFSGCKGVIGTMWSIQDEDAPKVTKAVYERMLKDGQPNRKEAARALHEAVKELRESGADFLSWVPFIHMGR
ncbi:hypothetical protein M408DRAFT_82008 [Serendipita vermifera MAFF 305830]|uniref:CHAT domain-containing protein n=1 Tax=Serendipita vermifera MAFF 305830 TaxID=933852 RepID=A0A0C2WSB3_SERVB|nr:hypothetical protein M408DRAFT_82008 [Serendipita vermifera MAFF 305830]